LVDEQHALGDQELYLRLERDGRRVFEYHDRRELLNDKVILTIQDIDCLGASGSSETAQMGMSAMLTAREDLARAVHMHAISAYVPSPEGTHTFMVVC